MRSTHRQSSHRPLIGVIALAALGGTARLWSGPATPSTRRPVSIYFTVEQGDKLIRGLTEKNFRLYEEEQSRQFRLAEPEKPISIALLVEYSQASYLYFEDIQAAIEGFMKTAPEGNWYALATFSHGWEVKVDFTKMIAKIPAALSEMGQPVWNEVDTFDAVYGMLDTMGRLPGRRVLILIGSGLDSFSGHTLSDAQKKAEATNVTIYAVGAGSLLRGRYEPYLGTMARMNLLQAQSFMQMLAEKSGGEAWFPNQEGAFPDVMKGIMQSLESQYRLVYRPQVPADGKFHKIKVEAFQLVNDQRHNFKVRVRQGWRF